ncbi:MAG: DUF3788 family protein [Acidobacteria bacterium]|nr:DUF3788 family protein [Acidobacteriota bacterium]
MDKAILSDPDQFPSEEIIFSHLGRAKPLWDSLFGYIHAHHPDVTAEWRYYRDAKSWLLKVTHKKKTIFWSSIEEGSFRTTFYFAGKAEEALMASGLTEALKEQFRNAKPGSKIRGITVQYGGNRDLEDAKILIQLKLRM